MALHLIDVRRMWDFFLSNSMYYLVGIRLDNTIDINSPPQPLKMHRHRVVAELILIVASVQWNKVPSLLAVTVVIILTRFLYVREGRSNKKLSWLGTHEFILIGDWILRDSPDDDTSMLSLE